MEYIHPTIANISKEDLTQKSKLVGELYSQRDTETQHQFINDLILGNRYYELKKPEVNFESLENLYGKGNVVNFHPDLTPKKYYCKTMVSKSGNIYVFREIVVDEN
jgi:hypothetical protein